MKRISLVFSMLCFGVVAVTAQNIGINTQQPLAALDVRSTGQSPSSYGVFVSNNASDTILAIRDDRKVGVGTSQPQYTLTVQTSDPVAGSFSGRVIGQNAVNGNEFVTLQQVQALSGGSGTQAGTMFSTPTSTGTNYYTAVMYCRNLTEGGFTNWRIPSTDELDAMLQDDAVTLPNFTLNAPYWLSDFSTYTSGSNGSTVFKRTFNFATNIAGSSLREYATTSASPYTICIR